MSEDNMLTQMFKDWRTAAELAESTRNDAVLKEARFKGAAELIYGPDATYEYSEESGLRFIPANGPVASSEKS